MKMFRAVMIMPFTIVGLIPLFILSFSEFDISGANEAAFYFGGGLFLIGLNFVIAVLRLFLKAGDDSAAPWDADKGLIVSGPYAYVRNPMVIGMLLMLFGESVFFHSLWIFIWALVYFTYENFYIIWYDEPKLAWRYGYKYFDYVRHVRRWIPRVTPWYEGRSESVLSNDDSNIKRR